MLNLYKAPKTKHNVHLFKYNAAAMLAFHVAALYCLFVEYDNNRAMAYAQIPWLLQGLRSYFVDRSYEIVGTAKMDDLSLFVLCPIFFSSFWNQVPNTALIFGTFAMLNGGTMVLFVEQLAFVSNFDTATLDLPITTSWSPGTNPAGSSSKPSAFLLWSLLIVGGMF